MVGKSVACGSTNAMVWGTYVGGDQGYFLRLAMTQLFRVAPGARNSANVWQLGYYYLVPLTTTMGQTFGDHVLPEAHNSWEWHILCSSGTRLFRLTGSGANWWRRSQSQVVKLPCALQPGSSRDLHPVRASKAATPPPLLGQRPSKMRRAPMPSTPRRDALRPRPGRHIRQHDRRLLRHTLVSELAAATHHACLPARLPCLLALLWPPA